MLSWREYWLEQQRQQDEQRRKDREQRLQRASVRLHGQLEALAAKFSLSLRELVELLELEVEWFGDDVIYLPCDE